VDCPWASCAALYDAGAATSDDFYAIDPDGPNAGATAFAAWCGMSLPRGGWTLVGHYYSGGGTMSSAGAAVGATPVTLDGVTSQRLSDATIAAFGPATYLVQSGTLHTRKAACDTYYQLFSPASWATSTNYATVRCSKDLVDWGASFDPTGISLNTQAGSGNWELNFCRSSGSTNGTTAQWVYNGPGVVQGDDLCANGGGPNNADKWLWVRDQPQLCGAGQVDCPYASCMAIRDAGLFASDGAYPIDPDGPNAGAPAFDAYCLMSAGGGGWTLVARVYGAAPYTFTYAAWPTLTPTGTVTNFSPSLLEDTVFPSYQTVGGNELLFYDATAACGAGEHRLMQTGTLLGGATLPAFLGALPAADCTYLTCASLPASNRITPVFLNTGCSNPFYPAGGGSNLPGSQVGINVSTTGIPVRFTVKSVDWDTGIGGTTPPDGSYAAGEVDILGDGVNSWTAHVVALFVR